MNRTNLPTILRREFHNSPFSAFDSFFEEALKGFPGVPTPTLLDMSKSTYPKVNVVDKEDEIVVTAAIPGLTKKDVKVDIEDHVLTISADKVNEDCEEGEDGCVEYIKRELHKSSFRRSFSLSDNLNTEDIKASMEDGMLKIVLPKIEPDLPKKMEVEIK